MTGNGRDLSVEFLEGFPLCDNPSKTDARDRAVGFEFPLDILYSRFQYHIRLEELPVVYDFLDFLQHQLSQLRSAGLRVTGDYRPEKLGAKIRDAQLQKIPYMLVIGDREAAEGTVSVRSRAGGDLGARPVAEFVRDAAEEVARKGR